MTDPIEQFLTRRFLNLYGSPDAVDPAAFVAEYGKALRGTDASILEEASDRVVKQHKYRNWPTVGECTDMVNVVAEQRAREREHKNWGNTRVNPHPVPTAEQRARVDALLAETKDKLKAVDETRKGARVQLPPTDRDAWEARYGKGPAS